MNKNQVNYTIKKYSNLVTRYDFSKIDPKFEESDLLEIQQQSYNKFFTNEVEALVSSFFPIRHAKNNKYEVKYNGIKFVEPRRDENKAREESKSYEKALYVDLTLINNETGEAKRAKKTKTNVSEGIFFANIPIMTEKGTFIVNGIEKFVISQIVRSPGAYILSKAQMKLNSKKKVNEGFICEILPAKGTLMNVWIDEDRKTVQVTARNITGENAPVFAATTLLKGLGLTQDEIRRIFKDDEYILNTLYSEIYNHQNIFDNYEISGIKRTVNDLENNKTIGRGSPIDSKLKLAIANYEKIRKENLILKSNYDVLFEEISPKLEALKKTLMETKPSEAKKINLEIEKLILPVEKALDKWNDQEKLLRQITDTIIVEKAAKDLIEMFTISTKSIENFSTGPNQTVCYQEVLARHFFDKRHYELTSAGRYKLYRKMRISERLYQRVIAEDLLSSDNKILIKKDTLILKDELDLIKTEANKRKLKILDQIHLDNTVTSEKNQSMNFETISVYADNESFDVSTPIIGISDDIKSTSLTLVDLLSIISYTINLPHGIGQYDDIDHMGNKRLKLIHEQLRSKLQVGMIRVEKQIKEKLASLSIETANKEQQEKAAINATIKSVVNTKPFQQIIKNFFNSYQLTQFIDQQNPLSELTNKRRISAMGDGGISREDPNLDIRDVHYSHYGRICPIETPEGMNIGLIMSLASFTKVDENGFLVVPYRRVVNGQIKQEIEWLTSLREDEYVIAESTVRHDENGHILDKKVICRYRASQELFDVDQINYIDVSPRQVVSVAASAIPFLENDDANRALMGANMQRQAIPLLSPYAPIVGTGSEYKIAHDSGMTIIAKEDGEVEYADGKKIIIRSKDKKLHTYDLVKYRKSNQNTCYNQTPIVSEHQKVKVGEILTDGPAMFNGELALGRNPLVAFTTWSGYNYEDAIIISERLVRDDVYTSITIEEYTIECLRTKNGDEEITRELPNVSEDSKRYLDEDGIIMVGAEVKEGDIIVGKISPKGQTDFTPEEKLLQAIFGNKTKNVRESSLKVPHGGEGIVAAIKRFSISKDDELNDDVIELIKVFVVQKRKIQIGDKMAGRHGNKGIVSNVVPIEDMPHLEDGTPIDILLNPQGVPSRMNIGQILEIHLGLAMRQIAKKRLLEILFDKKPVDDAISLFGLSTPKAHQLIKIAKKYLADKKCDSLAAAVKKIDDIDLTIILANVGLKFEDLNLKAATPVFYGANRDDVASTLKEAGIDSVKTKGKFKLIDGRTGEAFDGEITVGIMYMLKLDHMVDDKIHARSVGPYSKITQQPLGGKSQNGGQRFGEMEVWALEAYGAAYNLQELLTIKSDDVKGRNLTYSAIVKGRKFPQPNMTESFKLLTKQLQGLGLSIKVVKPNDELEEINNFSAVVNDEEDREFENPMDNSKNENVTVETIDNDSNDNY